MTDILNFFRILNAVTAFIITVCSLKKSNENPVFKPIAYLTAMLGFWNLIRFFLLQTHELQLSFIMMRFIFRFIFILLCTVLLHTEFPAFISQINSRCPCHHLYIKHYRKSALLFYQFKSGSENIRYRSPSVYLRSVVLRACLIQLCVNLPFVYFIFYQSVFTSRKKPQSSYCYNSCGLRFYCDEYHRYVYCANGTGTSPFATRSFVQY